MKTIKLIDQDGNKSVGIFQNNDGTYTAMTYTESKDFKTIKGAEKFLTRRGYDVE